MDKCVLSSVGFDTIGHKDIKDSFFPFFPIFLSSVLFLGAPQRNTEALESTLVFCWLKESPSSSQFKAAFSVPVRTLVRFVITENPILGVACLGLFWRLGYWLAESSTDHVPFSIIHQAKPPHGCLEGLDKVLHSLLDTQCYIGAGFTSHLKKGVAV